MYTVYYQYNSIYNILMDYAFIVIYYNKLYHVIDNIINHITHYYYYCFNARLIIAGIITMSYNVININCI